MRFLLDTHALIWFMNKDRRLPDHIVSKIKNEENPCFVSIASLWEIAIKHKNGRLVLEIPFDTFGDFLFRNNIRILSVELEYLNILNGLELFHRDPFDRLIIAQAISKDLTVFTIDKDFKSYPVKCLW